MDNNMIWRFRVLAEQVFRVAQILADHEDILSENLTFIKYASYNHIPGEIPTEPMVLSV